MNTLECEGLERRFGGVAALAGTDLTVAGGSLTALLGPSGCGKSTLLRVIAGFERVDSGSVRLRGEVVVGPGVEVPPERRRVGIVPQEQALFPHLSVAANVAYGLRRRSRETEGRAEEMLDLCGLSGLGGRMPHQLSGGQQQRVALARALAPAPSVVLLDEPFASLDATLRTELRAEIATILRAAGQTTLLVTHDQDEALSMADSVAVMRAGRILQHAGPVELYERPIDPWVAGFVGSANMLDGEMTGDGRARCALGLVAVAGADHASGAAVSVVLRPEQVAVSPIADTVEAAAGVVGVVGVVEQQDYHGHDALIRVRVPGGPVVLARVLAGAAPSLGSSVRLYGRDVAVAFPRSSPTR